MKLPELGVRRPVFTMMIFMSVLILGGISFYFIPIDMMPDIEQPAVSIITPYFGVSAEDVERLVTKEIENTANQVAGVDEITSMSKDNLSVVSLNFKWGTNLDEAMNDLRTALEFAKRSLPDDIDSPQLFKFGSAQFPILFYIVTATKSFPDLRTIVEKRVADRVKTVPGVGTVRMIAGLKRQINVEVDLNRLKAYNIPITRIGQALAYQNITITAGNIEVGRMTLPVRLPAEFKDPNEINDIIIGVGAEGGPIKVRDVARVTDGFNEQDEKVYLNKNPGMLFMVMKQSGGNTVEVANDVMARIAEVQKTLPSDVKIVKVYDMSQFIKDAIRNLEITIVIGGFLVILMVFLFLRRVRSSLVIAITIPFSLIVAFIFLYFLGYTINMMSLASLAIAVGMVVDTSIVILENITRRLEEGQSVNRAAYEGASEVGLAVTASAITTVVIFVPLLFVSGMTGVLFKQLAFAVAATLFGSLIAGLMMAPMLASKLLAKDAKAGFKTERGRMGIYRMVEKRYLKIIDWALEHRKKTLMIALGAFVLSLSLLVVTQTEFMPDEDTGDFQMMIELPPGSNVDESSVTGLRIMDIVMNSMVGTNGQQEWENVFMRTGTSAMGFSSGMGQKEGDNIIECSARMIKRELRTRSTFEYADIIRPQVEKVPGVMKLDVQAGNMINQLFGGGKTVQVEVKGADLFVINHYAHELRNIFVTDVVVKKKKFSFSKGIYDETSPGLKDVTVSHDYGRPSIHLKLDKERASMLGLNAGMIAQQLRIALFGQSVTKYRIDDNEYDIYLQLQNSDRNSIEKLKQVPLVNMMGKTITLGNVVKFESGITPIQIDRKDQERIVKVEANVATGANLGGIAASIKEQLEKNPPPPKVFVSLGGQIEEMSEAFTQLGYVALLGLLLVFMVMASQFENFIDPFIIMFSIPFALVGVFLFTVLTGMSFNLYSFLGIIMLMGIVVNNAIVFVDYTNILRRRGMALKEALETAGKHRLRPILMTTITTIFGMLPMALNNSEGAEFWRPLGTSVIGGLFLSGMVTLVLVPTMYMIIYSNLEKRGRGIRKEITLNNNDKK